MTVRSHTVNPDNENDDGGAVSGPRSEATIALSKTIARMFLMDLFFRNLISIQQVEA